MGVSKQLLPESRKTQLVRDGTLTKKDLMGFRREIDNHFEESVSFDINNPNSSSVSETVTLPNDDDVVVTSQLLGQAMQTHTGKLSKRQ